jgi:enoyl-CoA hydratase/carnithine racemase
LPELLGETAARELLLTGALVDAGWARAHGLVLEVVPPDRLDSRVAELVRAFDSTSREAVAATKRMLNERLGGLVEDALRREEEACVRLFEGQDARSALAAFAERR